MPNSGAGSEGWWRFWDGPGCLPRASVSIEGGAVTPWSGARTKRDFALHLLTGCFVDGRSLWKRFVPQWWLDEGCAPNPRLPGQGDSWARIVRSVER